MDYSHLLREELIAKLQEADNVIISLDATLDEAIRHEEEAAKLEQQLASANRDLVTLKREHETALAKIYSLTKEKNHMVETHQNEVGQLNNEIRQLRHQLVLVETINVDFETHDRLLEDKLTTATEFNNELLEKIAMLELEVERDRRRFTEQQLQMTDYQIETRELRKQVRQFEEERKLYVNEGDPDMLLVLIARVLDEGPPLPQFAQDGFGKLGRRKSMVKSISQDVHAYLRGREGMKPSKLSKQLHEFIKQESVK